MGGRAHPRQTGSSDSGRRVSSTWCRQLIGQFLRFSLGSERGVRSIPALGSETGQSAWTGACSSTTRGPRQFLAACSHCGDSTATRARGEVEGGRVRRGDRLFSAYTSKASVSRSKTPGLGEALAGTRPARPGRAVARCPVCSRSSCIAWAKSHPAVVSSRDRRAFFPARRLAAPPPISSSPHPRANSVVWSLSPPGGPPQDKALGMGGGK